MHSARIPIIGVFVLFNVILIIGMSAVFSHFNMIDAHTAHTHPQTIQSQALKANASTDGTPAITPRTTGTPAFTTTDVQQYVRTHQFSGGPTVSHQFPSIVTLQFISSKEANERLNGTFIGLPANMLVCFVVIKGPFLVTSYSHHVHMYISTVNLGVEVFDAHTGNQLVWAIAG